MPSLPVSPIFLSDARGDWIELEMLVGLANAYWTPKRR
jgi:hypothetical protein